MWKWHLRLWAGKKLLWSAMYDDRETVMKRFCSQRFINAARRMGATEWSFQNEQILSAG